MKTLTVRAAVLALAVVGVAATSVSRAATSQYKIAATSDPSTPAPLCLPGTGNYCGMQ